MNYSVITNIILVTSFLCCSCEILDISKDEAGSAKFTATIEGETWIAGTANGAHAPVITQFSNGSIQVEGYLNKSGTEKETLIIKIENGFNGTGTYEQAVTAYFFSDTENSYKTYSSEEFIITVAEFDGQKASGTFKGDVFYENEMIRITNGVFKELSIDNF